MYLVLFAAVVATKCRENIVFTPFVLYCLRGKGLLYLWDTVNSQPYLRLCSVYYSLILDGSYHNYYLVIVVIQNKKVVVFYGSQTGTGEGFAGRLAKDARRFGLPSMVYDPEDCTDWVSDYV